MSATCYSNVVVVGDEVCYSNVLGAVDAGNVCYSNGLGPVVLDACFSNILGPIIRISRPIGAEWQALEGVLGCGSYEALILTRGGGDLVAEFPWTTLDWSRVLDDTSEGRGDLTGLPENCCEDLARIRPWRHELALYRDGELVWVGPVYLPRAPNEGFEVAARGLTSWWDHRLIHQDHDYVVPTDLATIFQAIADDAMAPDPSPGLNVTTTPCGVVGTMQILASQHLMAGTKLRELAKIGIDWTEVGRSVIAGGAIIPTTGTLGPFLDSHFVTPPTPRIDGSAQANAWLVKGSGGGAAGDSVYAYDSDLDASLLDGLLESVASVSTIENFESAFAAARSRVALTSEVVAVENCVLTPDAPFTIDQLIPGVACTLALADTCIPVFGTYRLQKVTGHAAAPVGETITLTFQPLGTNEETV